MAKTKQQFKRGDIVVVVGRNDKPPVHYAKVGETGYCSNENNGECFVQGNGWCQFIRTELLHNTGLNVENNTPA